MGRVMKIVLEVELMKRKSFQIPKGYFLRCEPIIGFDSLD